MMRMRICFALVFLPTVECWQYLHRPTSSTIRNKKLQRQQQRRYHNDEVSSFILYSSPPLEENNSIEKDEEEEKETKLLIAPTSSSASEEEETVPSSSTTDETTSTTASVSTMMTREMKRILIEELGYKRRDVSALRVEMAPTIISQRIVCPSDGIPSEWLDPNLLSFLEDDNNDNNDNMIQRLKSESEYPLKFPLLGISSILFGKGFTDAVITIIKVSIAFPGASLTEKFLGVPVLAIDALCIFLGIALGNWTWNTMK